ncbi:MAG: YdcF family protein [Pseudomonadales bacterium]
MEIRLLLKVLALPPGLNILLGVLALALLLRWRRLGIALLAGNVLLLYCLSTPIVQVVLSKPLEESAPALSAAAVTASNAQAIVLLSGAVYSNAPEYDGHDSVMPGTLARMQYAAWLQRQTQLPLLVSGGSVYGDKAPIAEVMARVLREEFSIPVTWTDPSSRNTQENAKYTAEILIPKEITHIFLVTDASHIPRATQHFRHYGFDVIAAPTRFYSLVDYGARPWARFYPSASRFELSVAALHEYLGLLVARFE